MSLLRLQQPCAARADRRAALRARLSQPRSRTTAARVPGRTVSTIFFGGGTPSLMQPATIAGVLDAIARHWRVAPDAEVTLEANPTSVEADALSRLSRRRRQSRLARRAGARRPRAGRTWPHAHGARSARCRRRRAHGVRALLVRSDLRAAGPDAGRNGRASSSARWRKPASIFRSIS